MKKKPIMLLGLAFISMSAYSIEKNLPLTTTIDLKDLFSITKVEFEPAKLVLDLNSDNSGFEKASTKLKINTNIPMNMPNISYVATMIENNAICTNDIGTEFHQSDFVTVKFDDSPVTLDNGTSIPNFNSDDGQFKYSEHTVALEFKPFSEIKTNGSPEECSGKITFSIGVDI